ncbi:putative ATP-dependent RNA helicase DDX52 [Merluccius polli]|uniref:ATP-dependent RNA helicase n=1 Tax=Merluccius polli TaxID=89951 RepID=A0AA47P6J2_MERPO|nr:putative ATP-dependent RNA helicase DDX52 [Merluccius polli]
MLMTTSGLVACCTPRVHQGAPLQRQRVDDADVDSSRLESRPRDHAVAMDAVDLFRKLGAGAKFDLKRFGKDAQRFKIVRSQGDQATSDHSSAIDFFGKGSGSRKPELQEEQDAEEEDAEDAAEEEDEEAEDGSEVPARRKRKLEVSTVKSKKKKKATQGDTEAGGRQESAASNGISWTTSCEGKPQKQEEVKKTSLKRLKDLHNEKVNRIRNQNRIYVHGTDIPDPVCTFEELQKEYRLNPRVLQNLKEAGLSAPTAIQMQAVPLMMHEREILACAPTGSGKTLAFCLPLLAHLKQPANQGFRAVIISPTRELASQTHRELVRLSDGLGFRIHIIDKASLAAQKYGPQSSKKYDILVSTPNRLIYLLQEDPPGLDLSRVEWLVVDESDKLFEGGKRGFRDQLATLFLACSCPRVRRAFFSATCTADVEQWCRLNLDNLVSVNVGQRCAGHVFPLCHMLTARLNPCFTRNTAVETVEQELLFVGTENGKLLAVRDLIKKGFMPPMLVFVQSIDRARELFHELVYEGINVDVIHAERTQQQRDNVMKSFRSGDIWVLICTALLARGIDFKGVNLVLNYDFPTSAVEYIHRIGRTGRAGHTGKAVTFFTENDKPLLRSIANVIKQAGCPVPDYMMGLKKMHGYESCSLVVRNQKHAMRWLKQKPPLRTTISTTPRSMMNRNKGPKKQQKKKSQQAAVKPESETQNGSNTTEGKSKDGGKQGKRKIQKTNQQRSQKKGPKLKNSPKKKGKKSKGDGEKA